MQNVWGTDMPIRVEDYPDSMALRERFRQCRCGQTTFLDLPCRDCGRSDQEPVFQKARKRSLGSGIKRFGMSLLCVLAVCALLWLIWPPLTALAILVALLVLVPNFLFGSLGSDEITTCYWLFHQTAPKISINQDCLPMADRESLSAITDAYDGDLMRLERMLETDLTPERALLVFRQAQSMTTIYHNRRVSKLLMRCLLVLPVSEGICLDMEQVCQFLTPDDFRDDSLFMVLLRTQREVLYPAEFNADRALLEKLYDCVRFTCLCPGEATARFLVRLCASRVQRVQLYKNLDETVKMAAKTQSLTPFFDEKERKMIAQIWEASATGLTRSDSSQRLVLWEKDPAFANLCETPLGKLPPGSSVLADFWFDHVWYDHKSQQSRAFHRLVDHNGSQQSARLKGLWGNEEVQET